MKWVFIVLVHTTAAFQSVDMERTWMFVSMPFDSKYQCEKHRASHPAFADPDKQISGCMELFQAEALVEPYNRGAFILKKEKTNE